VKMPLGIFFSPPTSSFQTAAAAFSRTTPATSYSPESPDLAGPCSSRHGGSFPPRGFCHGRWYCLKSLFLGAHALVLDSFGPIRFLLKGACLEVVSYLGNLDLNLVGVDLFFLEIFASIS
jgi:hypothetical protein